MPGGDPASWDPLGEQFKVTVHNIKQTDQRSADSSNAYDFEQAPEQKRELRITSRKLDEYVADNREELLKPENKELGKMVIANSTMAKLAKQPREASMMAENMRNLSSVFKDKARGVKTSFKNKDPNEFLDKMKVHLQTKPRENQDYGTISTQYAEVASQAQGPVSMATQYSNLRDKLNWRFLAEEILDHGFLRTTFSPDCMYGPLEHPPAVRVHQERRKPEAPVAAVVQPEELDGKTSTIKDKDKQTEQRVLDLARDIRHSQRDKNDGKPLDFWGFVLNPESFAQTVENLFHLAFLVRDSKVEILGPDDNDGHARINWVANKEASDAVPGSRNRQAVVALDFPRWRKLVEIYQDDAYKDMPRVPARAYEDDGSEVVGSAAKRATASKSSQGPTKRRRS